VATPSSETTVEIAAEQAALSDPAQALTASTTSVAAEVKSSPALAMSALQSPADLVTLCPDPQSVTAEAISLTVLATARKVPLISLWQAVLSVALQSFTALATSVVAVPRAEVAAEISATH